MGICGSARLWARLNSAMTLEAPPPRRVLWVCESNACWLPLRSYVECPNTNREFLPGIVRVLPTMILAVQGYKRLNIIVKLTIIIYINIIIWWHNSSKVCAFTNYFHYWLLLTIQTVFSCSQGMEDPFSWAAVLWMPVPNWWNFVCTH